MDLSAQKARLRQALEKKTTTERQLAVSWRIEPSRLAHYKTSKYIFSEKIPWTGKDFKADILIDITWSMEDYDNYGHAFQSAKELISLFYGLIDFRIIVFWNWFYEVSSNEILSIDTTPLFWKEIASKKGGDALCEHCDNVRKKIKEYFPRKWIALEDNLYFWDWGTVDFTWSTNYYYPLVNSMLSLQWDDAWKMVVLITDWDENTSMRNWSTIWGINTTQFSRDYPRLIEDYKSENITLLPIWIGTKIKEFDNSIQISNGSEISWKVIDFLEKNI